MGGAALPGRVMGMQIKKRKIGLYGLLHSLKDDLGLDEGDVERFVESVDADPADLHDVLYQLAAHGLIKEDALNDYLDAADITADTD